MNLAATAFRIVPLMTRWASVTVMDAEGRILREFRVTGEQHDAIHNNRAKAPWHIEGTQYLMVGRALHPGMAVRVDGGALVVCYGDAGAHPKTVRLQPHEWSEAEGVVSVRSDLADMLTREWRG